MALRDLVARFRPGGQGGQAAGTAPAAPAWKLDERLEPFVIVSEVEDGEFFAGALFRRKFGDAPPRFGRHIVAFYRRDESTFLAASYCHFWTQGTIGLLGGGCTDGNVLRAMDARHLELVNQCGGLLRQTMLFAFTRFAAGLEAFFGHCGDARAMEVNRTVGWVETEMPHLLVRYNGVLTPARQQALLQQAHAIGPF